MGGAQETAGTRRGDPLSQCTLASPDDPITDVDRVRPGAGMRILVTDDGRHPVGNITAHDIHRLARGAMGGDLRA
jgi:hypothetical protein